MRIQEGLGVPEGMGTMLEGEGCGMGEGEGVEGHAFEQQHATVFANIR